MALSNTTFKVADLDFTSIKNNLKDYLKSQDTFTDYDFEGSGLNVLLDILAYNTFYNSYYMNMIANESFLDTAQMRPNILSHAKMINYVPNSRRGAEAVVNIVATPGQSEDSNTSFIMLDKYTRFLGVNKDNSNIPFIAFNSNSAFKVGNSFTFENVTLKQGEVITLEYLVTGNNSARRFEIPSQNVDTTTMIVKVQESTANSYIEEYFLADDITQLRSNTRAYFIEENDKLNYNIYFGDGVIGKRPANNNIVIVTYLDTLGASGNNVTRFTLASDPIGGLYRSNVVISTVTTSYTGTEKESIEQIRFRAPKSYTAQNRAVTKSDYETLITKNYQNIDAVNVWGGEEMDPPVYGKVYLSFKTKGFSALTKLELERIKDDLIRNLNVMTVTPEIVDPDYMFVLVRGRVLYDPRLTTDRQSVISAQVRNAVVQYSIDNLNDFKSKFILNTMERYIENSNRAISTVSLYFYLQKRITIQPNYSKNYIIDFKTPLKKGDASNKLYTYPQLTVVDRTNVARNVFFEEIPSSFTGISSIEVTRPGMNYTSIPTVTITGDGTGATAEAVIVNGKISKINITNEGSEYTRATVSITGGGGSEGAATATVAAKNGILRTYYYKANGEKIIVNPNAGTIRYDLGIIELTSLYATGTVINPYYEDLVLTLNVVPEEFNVYPSKNKLIALDYNDNNSIQLEVNVGQ